MKKRIVSFLMALVMAVSLLPVSALAADTIYSKHPEASKLRSCKASAHIPEWRRLEQEQPKPSAAQPKPQTPAPKKPVKKKPKAASTSTGTKQTAAVPTAEAPNGIITTDKDSILS